MSGRLSSRSSMASSKASPPRSTCSRCTTSWATRSAKSSMHRSSTSAILDREARAPPLPVLDRAGRPVAGRADRADRRPKARHGDSPAVPDRRATQERAAILRPAGRVQGEQGKVGHLRAHARRRRGRRASSRSRTTTSSPPSPTPTCACSPRSPASLSVALENARLIHETRQRVTELGTVNEIGHAVASQFDLDRMYELVGDLMRDTFSRRPGLRRDA